MKLPIKDNVVPIEAQSITLEEIAGIAINSLEEMAETEKDEMRRTTLVMSAFALREFLKE